MTNKRGILKLDNQVRKTSLQNTKYLNLLQMCIDSWQCCTNSLILFCGLYIRASLPNLVFQDKQPINSWGKIITTQKKKCYFKITTTYFLLVFVNGEMKPN